MAIFHQPLRYIYTMATVNWNVGTMDSKISAYECVCKYAFFNVSGSVKSVSNTINPDTAIYKRHLDYEKHKALANILADS